MPNIPLRKCIVCGKQDIKQKFIMVVRPPKNTGKPIYISLGQNKSEGRSAYICPNLSCIIKSEKLRRIEKAFRMKIEKNIYNEIKKVIENHE